LAKKLPPKLNTRMGIKKKLNLSHQIKLKAPKEANKNKGLNQVECGVKKVQLYH